MNSQFPYNPPFNSPNPNHIAIMYPYPCLLTYVWPLSRNQSTKFQYNYNSQQIEEKTCPILTTINSNQAQTTLEKKTYEYDKKFEYGRPYDCQNQVQLFIREYENINEKQSDIRYLELVERSAIREVPNLVKFRNIYNRGVHRYISSYKGDQRKNSWGKDDLVIFLWILDKYCKKYNILPKTFNYSDWINIAKMIPFRTPDDVKFKFFEMQRLPLFRNPWTKDQQQYLIALAEDQSFKEGIVWSHVSHKLYSRFPEIFRTHKQCRQHYNLLKTAQFNRAKKLWSAEQDLSLLENYEKVGRKWKTISKILIGRSQNAIKNRFTLLVSRYGKQETNHNGLSDSKIITSIKQKILQDSKNNICEKQNLIKRLDLIEEENQDQEQVSNNVESCHISTKIQG